MNKPTRQRSKSDPKLLNAAPVRRTVHRRATTPRGSLEQTDRKRPGLLEEIAARVGIQTAYHDMEGNTHAASRETLIALLQLWDIDGRGEKQLREALQQENLRDWRQCLDPAYALWSGQTLIVEARLPRTADKTRCVIQLEDGTVRKIDANLHASEELGKATIGGEQFIARKLKLPRLPNGYHELSLEVRDRVHRALVIVAPEASYSPSDALRSWGAFLPMYATHSERSWGGGDLGDWGRLAKWVTRNGGKFVSTLPLLPAFLGENMCEPSPYSPASRLFWNEYYLEIEALPEFQRSKSAQRLVGSKGFRERLTKLRSSASVNYVEEAAIRREVVTILAGEFFRQRSSARAELEKFFTKRPAVADYAAFRAASERSGSWHNWEPRLKYGKLEPGDYAEADRDYHLYAQWRAEGQFSEFIRGLRKQDALFYLDMPLGVHPDGYDIWRERTSFAFPASAGAPPDMFFTKGQDWGFAPLHPRKIRELGYSYVLDYLRFMMGHTGMLRIDHVMGLHRLYWVPRGFPPTEGAYVTYPAEELHAILSLESHRHKTVLVGENLGTVPARVNEAMERHHMRQIFVVQYEQQPDPKRAVRDAPVRSVASVNTHDMPTFAAHWNGLDLDDRADLGLIKREDVSRALKKRRKLNAALASFLRQRGFLEETESGAAATVRGCLRWLAAGSAEMVQVNLEDLWEETRPQNVPGTSTERPNWRRKTKWSIEEIEGSKELAAFLRELTTARQTKRRPRATKGRGIPS